jgi:lipopolysaccharide/colanic/teichoic acid biosynthesis glycosyltransferase
MRPDSDQRFGITQATEDDLRVTRVGRLLRATGLDEMPQLLNILKGEMSLVGPRALAVGEILRDEDGRLISYETIPRFGGRLAVKPGLTGMATVYLSKDAPPLRKLEMDLEYVERHSVWLDMKLVALSVWISLRGGWEKRGSKF